VRESCLHSGEKTRTGMMKRIDDKPTPLSKRVGIEVGKITERQLANAEETRTAARRQQHDEAKSISKEKKQNEEERENRAVGGGADGF